MQIGFHNAGGLCKVFRSEATGEVQETLRAGSKLYPLNDIHR